jgi:tRNA(Ile)-lysidine synthase
LRRFPHVVLAVSGGSDSVALMHLAAAWARSLGPDAPALSVATVDHGLRAGSAADAEFVVAAARSLDLDACVLAWEGDKPIRRIQERAREVRYQLLARHAAADQSISAIATGHTRDDQAETLLMRLARGSGPDGLQSMRQARPMPGFHAVFLVRPLLGLGRQQLREYLADGQIAWREDSSNENPQFERVRIRQAADVINSLGLSPPKLALAAERQRRAVDALEAATDDLQRSVLHLNGGAFASIDGRLFGVAPEELRIRLMSRVLNMFGGATPPADLAQVERLVADMACGGSTRTTLAGCEVRSCRNEVRIFRERGRAEFPALELRPGEEAVWDDRFHIHIRHAPLPLTVRVFDKHAGESLRRCAGGDLLLPARAAATLPAVWAGDELISVGGMPACLFSGSGSCGAKVETRFIFAQAPARTLGDLGKDHIRSL